MSISSEVILHDALALPAVERVKIVDQLLSSLDEADSLLDAKWAKEAESRLDAFDRGEIRSIPLEDILARYHKG
ncbi:MAG: addiction module protein, partial [Methylococcaceae bacterium]|nr:addiction module protein [Methylococcaceae bacterium]